MNDLTPAERVRIAPYVTDVEGPVFALRDLPEVVKGALFARYSRSPKSLRRLLIDEFLPPDDGPAPAAAEAVGQERAAGLYDRVLTEYGDDSVAQLGAAHVAVEGASNILTKVLEWGRLAAYLEQSTRYVPYTDRPGGSYRFHRPAELRGEETALSALYARTLDAAFATYTTLLPHMEAHVGARVPDDPGTPAPARARAVRAQALDLLRGLLPAATTANVGIFASGQAYEAMLVRMAAHPLAEARDCAAAMLRELRKVIPAFLTRVDRPDRGGAQSAYLAETERETVALARELFPAPAPALAGADGPAVRLLDHDPDGEERVLAAALWPASGLCLGEVRRRVAGMDAGARARVLDTYVGRRGDRRWRPGRAFEETGYTFEVVVDYGAYRDLQRHRLLTLQAQPLTTALGWTLPPEVADAGAGEAYAASQAACASLHEALAERAPAVAGYAVTLAHRIRFTMTMNAREAMHLIELRSQPQGHESYRWVAQEMHRLIADEAGHRAIAGAMAFVDRSTGAAGRLAAEQRGEERRRAREADAGAGH